MLRMGRTKWKSQTGRVGRADLACFPEVTAHLPHKGKWAKIWMGEGPWPIGAGDNDPDSLGLGASAHLLGVL